MTIHYYKANDPGDAFHLASKDMKSWSFAESLGLADMAQAIRNGFTPTQRFGSGLSCVCDSGLFLLFADDIARGYGVGIVQLRGHESGIDDPSAQEILDYHRVHKGQPLFADKLLVWAGNIATLDDLDRGYELLEQANLIRRAGGMATFTHEGQTHARPLYFS